MRNHDELSLAHLTEDLANEMQKQLAKQGKVFREGYGISGRTFSLLKNSKKKFRMAYFLLASFPGSFMFNYGDEIGKSNIPFKQLKNFEQKDTRNINRGILYSRELSSPQNKLLIKFFQQLLKQREEIKEYLSIWPIRMPASKGIFAANYQLQTSELLIFINLTGKIKAIRLDCCSHILVIATVNNAILIKRIVRLGPYAGIWLIRE